MLEVCLVDTSTERDVRLDRELVRAGHADSRPDSALAVSVAAPPAAEASDADSDEVDSLLAVVLHCDGRSEVSASASEAGRAPAPRIAPWGCDVADAADAADAAPAAPAGSLRLARLRALHAEATRPAARSLLLRRRLAAAKAT